MTTKIQIFIYIIFLAIICASVFAYYNGKVLGGFIRRLDEKNKNGIGNTATIRELGYSRISAFFISLSLGENSSLRKYVSAEFSREEMEIHKEKGLSQRYFLAPEKRELALKRYNGEKMKLWKLITGILACIVAAVICINLFPYIISMVSGAGESFDTERTVTGERIEETQKLVQPQPAEEDK